MGNQLFYLGSGQHLRGLSRAPSTAGKCQSVESDTEKHFLGARFRLEIIDEFAGRSHAKVTTNAWISHIEIKQKYIAVFFASYRQCKIQSRRRLSFSGSGASNAQDAPAATSAPLQYARTDHSVRSRR